MDAVKAHCLRYSIHFKGFFFKFVGILKDKAKRSFQRAYKCEIRKLKIDDKLRRKTITKLGLL